MATFTTRTIAEMNVSEAIIKALVADECLTEAVDLFAQDIIHTKDVFQADLVITDYVRRNNDKFITSLMEVVGKEYTIEVIELAEAISTASEDRIDNMIIYTNE